MPAVFLISNWSGEIVGHLQILVDNIFIKFAGDWSRTNREDNMYVECVLPPMLIIIRNALVNY